MAYGVQVNASNGNKLWDTADNMSQFYDEGTFTITNGSSTSSSVSVSGLTNSSIFHVLISNEFTPYDKQSEGVVTKSSGSFTFQRTDQGSADTTGTLTYRYVVIKTA